MSIPTLTLRALLAALLTTPLVLAQGGLQLSVVEGQGAENSIEKNLGAAIVVELRDGSGAPIPQAEITFQSPADGASVTFFGASHTSKAWTDEQGQTHLFLCDGYAASAEALQAAFHQVVVGHGQAADKQRDLGLLTLGEAEVRHVLDPLFLRS